MTEEIKLEEMVVITRIFVFTTTEMESHWRILSRKETWSVFYFNKITPHVILRIECRQSRAEVFSLL